MPYLLQLLGGLVITNGIPHFAQGLSGAPFQSPFASPPGVGESSPLVNVYWGFLNLAGGALLVAKFATGDYLGWACVGLGSVLIGTFLAIHFGNVRRKATT